MRVLVTGASGLLGLNLALEAAKMHQVFGLVNRHPLKTEDFQVIQADLLIPGTAERILDQTQPDWVIHCAALALIDECEAHPEWARQINTEIPKKLATYVDRGGARFLHVSTDAVFDGVRGDYSETDEPNPLSVYARTKLEAERAVAAANPGALIARVNLFGWSLTRQRSLGEFFYYNLKAGKRVMGFTDVYFCPLLANDLANLLMEMLSKQLSGLYHTVSRECLSKYEFGVAVARQFGFDEDLIQATSVTNSNLAAVRSPRLTLRTDKLTAALGKPPPSVAAGLKRFFLLDQQGYPERLARMTQRIHQ